MNKEFAISFLQKNQPMPDDKSLSQEAIDTYCEVLSYIKENPDNDFIALFLIWNDSKIGMEGYKK